MKFFIDTANIDEIKEASSLGVIDGVTTNPSLIAQTGRDLISTIQDICTFIDGPISVECVKTDASSMVKEGLKIAQIHPNVVVKIPATIEGLKTVKILSAENIKTNVTLCFSATQGLMVAKAGATYVSPFIGRLDDISHDGLELIEDLVHIYDNYGFSTQVLAASIRHPLHVLDAAKIGAHVATIPFKVLSMLMKHPLTDIGNEKFLKDWEKVPQHN